SWWHPKPDNQGCVERVQRGSVWRRTLNVVDNHSVYWFRTQDKFQSKLFLQGRRQGEAIVRRSCARRRVGPGCAKGFGGPGQIDAEPATQVRPIDDDLLRVDRPDEGVRQLFHRYPSSDHPTGPSSETAR